MASLQFKVDSKQQIFEKLFNGNFHLLLEFLPDGCREEVAEEIFFHISVFIELYTKLIYILNIKFEN